MHQPKTNYFRNAHFEVWIEEDFFYACFLCKNITDQIADEIIKTRLSIAGDKPYKAVLDARKVRSLDKEARIRFNAEDGAEKLLSFALVIDSRIGQMLANFYFRFSYSPIPRRIFNSLDEAKSWSKSIAQLT